MTKRTIIDFVRPAVQAMMPYQSGKLLTKKLEAESGQKIHIRLDANENPYENPFAAGLTRYPEQRPLELITAMAKFYEVDPAQILVLPGSDHGIRVIQQLACEPAQDAILTCPHSFQSYGLSAKLLALQNIEVPLIGDDLQLDVAGIKSALESHPNIRVIYIPQPAVSSGHAMQDTDIDQILAMARNRALVVVDEAYQEFTGRPSYSTRMAEFPHLLVSRTLSKAFSLAGVRIGVLLAQPELIAEFQKVLEPFHSSDLAFEAALQAFSPAGISAMKSHVQKIIATRIQFEKDLKNLSHIKQIGASQTNFIAIQLTTNTLELYRHIGHCGIAVRPVKVNGQDALRVTIGTPEDMKAVLTALESFA